MKTVDPSVYALAESFVADLLTEINGPMVGTVEELVMRVAEAAQGAIESECNAIVEESNRMPMVGREQ